MHARVGGQHSPDYPPVILLHGLSISSRYLVPVATEAARWTLVHAPDLPGFGLSGNPETILDIPGLADATAAWIAVNELPPVIVLGNSVGSQIAVNLAARYPDRVAGIVLTGLALGGQQRNGLSQVARALADAPREPLRLWPMQAQDFLRAGPWRVLRTFRLALRDRIEMSILQVTAPALVVEGTNDPMGDPAWNHVLIRQLADGRHAVVEGGTHALPMTRPVALSALVREFAAEITAAAR
jgi:pimeloyl-ACP methyl ester carboxylesterase